MDRWKPLVRTLPSLSASAIAASLRNSLHPTILMAKNVSPDVPDNIQE
jgi:hypothetical protein